MAPIIPTFTYNHNIPILPRDLNLTIEALDTSKVATPSNINTIYVKDTIKTEGTAHDKRIASDIKTCSWGILDIFCSNKQEAYSKSYEGIPLNATHSISTRFIPDAPSPKEPLLPSIPPSIMHGSGPKEPLPPLSLGTSCGPNNCTHHHHNEPMIPDIITPCAPGQELACHMHHPRSLNANLAVENARVQNFLFIAIVVALVVAMFVMGLGYWRRESRERRWFARVGVLERGGKKFESVEKEEEEEEEEDEWRIDEGVLAQSL